MLPTDALGLPADQFAATSNVELDAAIESAEHFGSRLSGVLASSAASLTALHKIAFPTQEPPKDLHTLADTFKAEGDSFPKFLREQTVRGSASAFKMLLGHGVELDLSALAANFPLGSAGKKVSLSQFEPEARRLANILFLTLEQRGAARKKKGSAASVSGASLK